MGSNVTPLASKTKHFFVSSSQYVSLLESYTNTRSLTKIKHIHAQIITSGTLSFASSPQSFTLRSNLASSYALCGHVLYARKLFDELRKPKLFLYNAVIRMYSQSGSPFEVLKLFESMISSGYLTPDSFTYPFVVKACGDLALVKYGVVVHSKVITSGFGSNLFVLNSLLAMYMSCGAVEMAKCTFGVMWERDMVSWATVISGFVRNGCVNEASLIFVEMIDEGVEPNSSAVVSVLSTCRCWEDLGFGKTVHGIVEVKGLQDDVGICNALIDMYARCGSVGEAKEVFDRVKNKDVVTWTSLIKGYIRNGNARYALELCWSMHLKGVVPNVVTVAMLLQACGTLQSLKQGRCLHAWVVRQNIINDAIIETALIDMYAKCHHISCCFLVFTQSSQKRVASWNAMISAYIYNTLSSDAILCFKEMLHNAVDPDAITFSSLLCAYADLADAQQAFSVHSYMLKSGILCENEVVRSLIDVYFKCGKLDSSENIFSEVSLECRNISLWCALIAGYGAHGHGENAVLLFRHMVQSGIKPNEVVFTCVLDACSHAGLVDEGLEFFKLMLRICQTKPSMYHYTCVVDLLGRACRLQEAYDLILTMPYKPSNAIWSSLLGACAVHQNVELGEIAAQSLIALEPENTSNYILLANIYASAGRWEDAEKTRSMVSKFGSGKTPGHSLAEGQVI